MKSILVTFLLFTIIFCSSQLSSQELKVGNNYYFKSNVGSLSNDLLKIYYDGDLYDCDVQIQRNHNIKIIDIINETVFFKYLDFKVDETDPVSISNYNTYNVDPDTEETLIFSLDEDDFKILTSPLFNAFRGFKYGSYTVPIRLRDEADVFEFDSNLSLGANLLYRWGSRTQEHLYVDFSLGIGLTKSNLTPDNSLVGSPGDFEMVESLSPTAFTVSLGATLNFAKNVNIGFYYGWDNLSSSDNLANWVFDSDGWFGIGLNVGFSGEANNSQNSRPSPAQN